MKLALAALACLIGGANFLVFGTMLLRLIRRVGEPPFEEVEFLGGALFGLFAVEVLQLLASPA